MQNDLDLFDLTRPEAVSEIPPPPPARLESSMGSSHRANWYDNPYEVNKLLRYLAETDHDAMTLVYAHEKPWKFEKEYLLALETAEASMFGTK